MFPIGDENRRDHVTPVVNYLLIAINVAVFFYQIRLGNDGAIQEFIKRFGVIPREIAGRQDLYTFAHVDVHAWRLGPYHREYALPLGFRR
jgi:membrane associated rhomboid family serine protease